MPAGGHLDWREITDFRPGLWTKSTHLMPATAAQQMDDCYPYPGGGLRAFHASSAAVVSGSGITAGQQSRGFFIRPMQADPSGTGIGISDLALMTSDDSSPNNDWELYDMQRSASASTWTSRDTFANGTGGVAIFQTFWAEYLNDIYFTVNMKTTGTADEGLWRFDIGSAPVQNATLKRGIVVAHQDRLVVGNGPAITFSAPGGTDLTVGSLDLLGAINNNGVSWMVPVAPSDLLVGLLNGQILNIQGDLADPTVREMGQAQSSTFFHVPCQTPEGIAVMAGNDGIYLMGSGGDPRKISEAISPSSFAGDPDLFASGGVLVYYRDWLWCPGGLLYDLTTQAWFKVSAMANSRYLAKDTTPGEESVIGATNSGTVSFPGVVFSDGFVASTARATDFTWKSAPLRDPSGRQLEIREVDLVVRTYESSPTLTVTVNGTARTSQPASAGKHVLRFLFSERGHELDITVRSQGGGGSTEAPSIEAVLIGSRPGHLV